MRRTKDCGIALERLAASLNLPLIDAPDSGRGHVTVDVSHRVPERYQEDEWVLNGFRYTGAKRWVLAKLVIIAMDPPSVGFELEREEVAKRMRLKVLDNDHGLAAHEYQSLRSVTLDALEMV